MAKRKRKAYDFKFSVRNHSIPGLIASVFALASVILFIVCVVCSTSLHGEAGLSVGAAGMFGMLTSVVTFIVGCVTIKKNEEYFKLFPVMALVLSSIGLICWIGMCVLGFL